MSESTKQHKASAPRQLNFAVFVCSSSRHQQLQKGVEASDASGDTIVALLTKAGHNVLIKKIIADDVHMIKEAVESVLCSIEVDAAIFCGGTGIAPKDVTIETVSPYFEKMLPGFGEIFRLLSYEKIGSAAVMSRAVAGVAKGKVLFCIPGSPDAVQTSVEKLILPEAPHIVRHARE
ncbi:MAG: molybdenum cofactor biosynthesis protein MoaB [Candidatus Bathyarchaeota archaeon]|nr:molybdenum cofactor biosynthesis protein MoaB [Candidatus Bathyarchaeota archaeon]